MASLGDGDAVSVLGFSTIGNEVLRRNEHSVTADLATIAHVNGREVDAVWWRLANLPRDTAIMYRCDGVLDIESKRDVDDGVSSWRLEVVRRRQLASSLTAMRGVRKGDGRCEYVRVLIGAGEDQVAELVPLSRIETKQWAVRRKAMRLIAISRRLQLACFLGKWFRTSQEPAILAQHQRAQAVVAVEAAHGAARRLLTGVMFRCKLRTAALLHSRSLRAAQRAVRHVYQARVERLVQARRGRWERRQEIASARERRREGHKQAGWFTMDGKTWFMTRDELRGWAGRAERKIAMLFKILQSLHQPIMLHRFSRWRERTVQLRESAERGARQPSTSLAKLIRAKLSTDDDERHGWHPSETIRLPDLRQVPPLKEDNTAEHQQCKAKFRSHTVGPTDNSFWAIKPLVLCGPLPQGRARVAQGLSEPVEYTVEDSLRDSVLAAESAAFRGGREARAKLKQEKNKSGTLARHAKTSVEAILEAGVGTFVCLSETAVQRQPAGTKHDLLSIQLEEALRKTRAAIQTDLQRAREHVLTAQKRVGYAVDYAAEERVKLEQGLALARIDVAEAQRRTDAFPGSISIVDIPWPHNGIVPDETLSAVCTEIERALQRRHRIYLLSANGCGRVGTLAAALVGHLYGLPPAAAIHRIQSSYRSRRDIRQQVLGGSKAALPPCPATLAQQQLVHRFLAKTSSSPYADTVLVSTQGDALERVTQSVKGIPHHLPPKPAHSNPFRDIIGTGASRPCLPTNTQLASVIVSASPGAAAFGTAGAAATNLLASIRRASSRIPQPPPQGATGHSRSLLAPLTGHSAPVKTRSFISMKRARRSSISRAARRLLRPLNRSRGGSALLHNASQRGVDRSPASAQPVTDAHTKYIYSSLAYKREQMRQQTVVRAVAALSRVERELVAAQWLYDAVRRRALQSTLQKWVAHVAPEA